MIQSPLSTSWYQNPEIGSGKGCGFRFTLPQRARSLKAKVDFPAGLVVSSDKDVLRKLAKTMGKCGLATFLAFTVGESKRIVDRHEVCLVLCDDHLIDGNYEDILFAAEKSRAKTPVIVVSRTGDWPDYLKTTNAGVFNYLAYPPILGELPRAICNAMAWRTANPFGEAPIHSSNSLRGEMS